MHVDDGDRLQQVRRQVRLVAILSAARAAGLLPLPTQQLHTIAYFADALAPVWGLRILDSQLLKRHDGPMSPLLQQDLDLLVGRGLVIARSVRHTTDSDGKWRLEADYELNDVFAVPVLRAASQFGREVEHFAFVREVVYAMSGLGLLGIAASSGSDASYGDEVVDFGEVVDLESARDAINPTARVATRFGELMADDLILAPAELVHLYVRELYNRINRAA